MSDFILPSKLSLVCQQCQQGINDIRCPYCHCFTQQTNHNYFDLFHCVHSLDIDLEQLQQRYYVLQQLTHPDQLQSLKVSERIKATALNQLINQAYQVLKNPLQRAKYLFDYQESEHTIADPILLSEIMDLQDALLESDTEAELLLFKSKIQCKFDTIFNQLKMADSIYKSSEIIRSLDTLNYYTKLLTQVNDQLEKHLNRFDNVTAN